MSRREYGPVETLHSARKRVEEAELRRFEATGRVARFIAGVRLNRAENIMRAVESQPIIEVPEQPDMGGISSVH